MIKELLIKHGAIALDKADDPFTKYALEEEQAQAFADEYLALSSSELIEKAAYAGAREDLSIWKKRALEAEEKVRIYDQRIIDVGAIAMSPIKNPLNQQLLAERNELDKRALGLACDMNLQALKLGECVEEIKRLRDALKHIEVASVDIKCERLALGIAAHKAIDYTPASIQKLLGE